MSGEPNVIEHQTSATWRDQALSVTNADAACLPALARTAQDLMPIRRQHRWLYPIDWRELSASIRFRRAKGRCEHCGRPHGKTVQHLGDGRWWDEERNTWRNWPGQAYRAPTGP